MKTYLLHAIIFCGIILGTVVAQEGNQDTSSPAVISIPKPPLQINKNIKDGVILVFNSDNAREILVVTDDGQWVPDARKITIVADLTNNVPVQVECIMWKGLFKPENPQVELWGLSGVISADTEAFSKILQDLQNGRFSL